MNNIEETLKRIAAATSKAGSPATRSEPSSSRNGAQVGDPNCPICHGVGFVRRDLPVGDPNFGKIEICACRNAQVSQGIRQRLQNLSNLNAFQNLTFETFQPHGQINIGGSQAASLEYAFNSARSFAASTRGWLLLQGGYGCGKTHLAAAIANFAVQLGVPTLFITVPDLLDWLRFSYDSDDLSFEERFEEIRNIRLLVMDDFGTQNATPWAQEKLFQILNYRYNNRLPLVVTTNLRMDDIEGRIRSRLTDPELVLKIQILAPDYRNPREDTLHPDLSSLAMHGQRTFGNFSLRNNENLLPEELKSLEQAFKAAQKFAKRPSGWLVFTGSYGCGKTHLAAAIGNYRAQEGDVPMLVVVPDLLDHLRATFNPASNVSYDQRFDEVRSARLLILDDLGTHSATPWAQEKLFQIFNYRYNAELPTVITTSNLSEKVDPRLVSRMQDERLCTILPITVPGYKGSLKSTSPAKPDKSHKPGPRGRSNNSSLDNI
jgi:DNA replication protein DnaC